MATYCYLTLQTFNSSIYDILLTFWYGGFLASGLQGLRPSEINFCINMSSNDFAVKTCSYSFDKNNSFPDLRVESGGLCFDHTFELLNYTELQRITQKHSFLPSSEVFAEILKQMGEKWVSFLLKSGLISKKLQLIGLIDQDIKDELNQTGMSQEGLRRLEDLKADVHREQKEVEDIKPGMKPGWTSALSSRNFSRLAECLLYANHEVLKRAFQLGYDHNYVFNSQVFTSTFLRWIERPKNDNEPMDH